MRFSPVWLHSILVKSCRYLRTTLTLTYMVSFEKCLSFIKCNLKNTKFPKTSLWVCNEFWNCILISGNPCFTMSILYVSAIRWLMYAFLPSCSLLKIKQTFNVRGGASYWQRDRMSFLVCLVEEKETSS